MAFDIRQQTMSSQVNADGSIGQVVNVRFVATKSVDDISTEINTNMAIPLGYPPAQIPFDTVTEADIDAWIRDIYPEATLESELDLKLTAAATPILTDQVPWESSYPLWANAVAYAVDDVVLFNTAVEGVYMDVSYQAVQAHTSQLDWTPPTTPALWKVYTPEGTIAEWVQPTGAQDAYNPVGVQVWWDAGAGIHLWTSNTPDNVWEPGVFGWDDEGPYVP